MSGILFLLHEENTKANRYNEGDLWEISWEKDINTCITTQYGTNF